MCKSSRLCACADLPYVRFDREERAKDLEGFWTKYRALVCRFTSHRLRTVSVASQSVGRASSDLTGFFFTPNGHGISSCWPKHARLTWPNTTLPATPKTSTIPAFKMTKGSRHAGRPNNAGQVVMPAALKPHHRLCTFPLPTVQLDPRTGRSIHVRPAQAATAICRCAPCVSANVMVKLVTG
jgi:hypothetical protein